MRKSFSPLVVVSMLLAFVAHANTLSWSGGGGADVTWGNIANWGFVGTPTNGDTLIFPAFAPNLVNSNNIGGLTLNQIRFAGPGGGYDIRGTAFTLTNSIWATNSAGANTIENIITLTGAVQVEVSNSVSLTLDGNLIGSGGVNKTGLGTLTYQAVGNNSYTGTTLVSAGTLQLNVSGPTAFSGPLVIGDGTGNGSPEVVDLQSFEMEHTGPITINLNGLLELGSFSETVNVNTNFMLNGGGIQTFAGTLGLSPNTTFNTGSNNSTVIDGNLNIGSGTLTIQGSGLYVEFYANVSGAANIVQNDSVSTMWVGINTYTGNYTANGDGLIEIGSSYALGNTNNTMTLNGQTAIAFINNSTATTVTNQSLTVNSSQFGNGGIGAYFSSTNSWQASNFVFNVTNPVFVDTNCALNLIGPISGPSDLIKAGPGVLTLSGSTSNSYTGTTTVNQGTLLLGKTAGATAIPGSLEIDSGATVRLLNSFQMYNPFASVTMFDSSLFDLAGFSEWVGPTSMQGARITAGSGDFYFSGNITVNSSTVAQSLISGNAVIWAGTYTITNSGHNFSPDLRFTANLFSGGAGAGGLIKDGGGEVSLSGNNSFLGPVTINNGDLWAQSSTSLGNTNMPATVNNGATLFLDGTGLDFGLKPLVLNGPGYYFLGSLTCNGSSSWEGTVTLNTGITIYPFTASSLTVTGAISGAGGVIMAGPGTLTYAGTGPNTYAGLTTVNGGTLLLSKTAGNPAVPGNLVVSNASSVVRLGNSEQLADADVLVTNGGLFDFAVSADYINTLRGNGTVNFGVNGFVNIGFNNGTSEFDGSMVGAGYAPGYTVGKFGTGTFTLGGNNSFSAGGYHVISPGRLLVNGSGPTIPAIVDNGAVLGGFGSVGIISAAGTVSPGEGPGILTSSNLVFTSSGYFLVALTGPDPGVGGYNQLIANGTVTLASATLSVEPAFATTPSIGQQFTVIKNNGGSAVSGTFNGLANGAQFNIGGYFFRINYNGGAGNDVVLTLIGVPQKTVTLNAVDTGWYDSTGFHDPSNPNYLAGQDSLNTDTNLFRNFFVFNAPVSTNSIISAELIINDYICSSPNGRETYVLYDVTNAISALEAGGSGLTNIYNDLGEGGVYGIRTVSTNETSERAIIPLNYGFINALSAAAGGQIALGGTITTLEPTNGHNQYVFGFSFGGNPTDVQLRVSYGTSILTNAIDQGWYNSSGLHTAGNLNYFAGVFSPDTNFYRDFFVFNVPPFPGQPVNASLWVNSFGNGSPSGLNAYQLRSVSTPTSTLTNNGSGATNIYADLAAGTLYGGRDVYVTEHNHFLGIPLNNTFITAAANSGGSIALGGSVSSLTLASTNESLFAASGGPATNVQLWLGFFPSPEASPSFTEGTPTYLGNNSYQLTLSGLTDTTNEIQSTFDFQNWDYITDVAVPAAPTTFYYTNSNFTVPHRIFRSRLLP